MGAQTRETTQGTRHHEAGGRNGQDQPQACRFSDPSGAEIHTWEQLVRRYRPYLMRVAASYNLGEDASDAVQHAFLRLLENADTIRDPQAVRGWLAAVVRNECLRLVSRRRREQLYEHDTLDALLPPARDVQVDAALLQAESAWYVRKALEQLPLQQRRLLETLVDPDTESYRHLAERLNMPMGSVGPTRQRALARLKAALAALNYDARREVA